MGFQCEKKTQEAPEYVVEVPFPAVNLSLSEMSKPSTKAPRTLLQLDVEAEKGCEMHGVVWKALMRTVLSISCFAGCRE
jgi:hypothetical protein